MKTDRLTSRALAGKVIDAHCHVGVSLKAYATLEYPCAESLEGIYYRQAAGGVDVSVVFPFTPDLFFAPGALVTGACRPAARPLSPAPYAVENERVLLEVHRYCREWRNRFLPFVSVDPVRRVAEQLRRIRALAATYPIYGVKISPVLCQSPVTALLTRGRGFLDLARERNWPLLLHTTAQHDEQYSTARLAFRVIERNPDVRFCLAHCIGFSRPYLERAADMPNVWFDTAAMKIQVQAAREGNRAVIGSLAERIPAHYADHRRVMRELAERFPDKMIWGSDTPAYSYFSRRKQGDGLYAEFALKGKYEDELAALRALPRTLQRKVANENTRRFLFGAL